MSECQTITTELPDYLILKNCCPQCGGLLFATWTLHRKGLPVWHVQCDKVSCKYTYKPVFQNLEDLLKRFELAD